MNGEADLPHRSSSPLKRRASSMDPEMDGAKEDVSETPASASAGPVNGMSRHMSADAPDSMADSSVQPPPPLMEQVKIIETLLKAFQDAPVKEGETAYLVSRSWVDQALSLRKNAKLIDADAGPPTLGPVDNSDIIAETLKDVAGDPFIRLKPGADSEVFELFPEDAWKLVMDWYGLKEGQLPITRTAINTSFDPTDNPNILFELHPPVFQIYRLWSEVSGLPIEQSLKASNPGPLLVTRSRKYRAQTFLKEIKTLTGVPLDRKVQIWFATPPPPSPPPVQIATDSSSALTPPDSPVRASQVGDESKGWPHMLLDLPSFTKSSEPRNKVLLPDETGNPKYNGKSTLQMHILVSDQTLVLDEAVEGEWVSTFTGRPRHADKSIPTRSSNNATASSLSRPGSDRGSPALEGLVTRGRMLRKKGGRSVGAVGLQNLGNTCYMNSALQCVRSVEELTKYFLTDVYVNEINDTNALAYEGRVAMAYGGLLKEIYTEGKSAVSPRDFKITIGKCQPIFSGWGQQDSQEFLHWFLDGLQEDLSRIKKKPYIEKPESTDDMINDPGAIKEMAEKVWDITKRRDDSVIADLFTGLYQSTLKCPECGNISITFDPFNNLTLQLPLENVWTHSVKFYPLNDVPVKIDVELPKHSSIEVLKQFVSARTGVPVERLMGAEEFKDRFFKIYDNSQDATEEIQQSDVPAIHEIEAVPTNWPAKGGARKKYRSMLDVETPLDSEWDDPRYDSMVVPVLHRRPYLGDQGAQGTSPPHFIVLTKEEASSYDAIQRKILEKLATFSTWSKFHEVVSTDGTESTDTDVVIANASDADSSGDGKVVAQSIESEDDIIDVKMKDGVDKGTSQDSPGVNQPQILKRFNHHRPRFVDTKEFLNPALQNLFDLSYYASDTDGPVPTAWSSSSSKGLPRITDRMPETSSKDGDEASPQSWNSTQSGSEESSNEGEVREEVEQTRMAAESSDEEMSRTNRFNGKPGGRRSFQKGGAGGKKKFKGHKAYGKKGNKKRDKAMRSNKDRHRMQSVEPQPQPAAVADGGPLIRLHEAIIVEWNEDAWEAAFGAMGRDKNSTQGSKSFIDLETLQDTALKTTRRRRQTRRTKGITLEECLDEFERTEVLSEQNMWYCPRCKEHRRASKKFDLWKTPDYLVAHLKRFSNSGWRRDKIDVFVDFPIEGLDLTSRVIQKEDGKSEIYDLVAVDDHYGGLGGGHYTAYAKNFVDGRWYSYNDSSVSQVTDPSSLVTNAAYLLFYRRRSQKILGGAHFEEIFDKFNTPESEDGVESDDDGSRRNGRTLNDRAPLKNGASGDDDELPSYGETLGQNSLRRSIENDGEENDDYEKRERASLDMTQGWSFHGLSGSGSGEIASDDAQQDSSGDERGRPGYDQDTDMASTGDGDVDGSRQPKVITVPVDGDSDVVSDDVTEIRLESEKTE